MCSGWRRLRGGIGRIARRRNGRRRASALCGRDRNGTGGVRRLPVAGGVRGAGERRAVWGDGGFYCRRWREGGGGRAAIAVAEKAADRVERLLRRTGFACRELGDVRDRWLLAGLLRRADADGVGGDGAAGIFCGGDHGEPVCVAGGASGCRRRRGGGDRGCRWWIRRTCGRGYRRGG